MDLVKASGKSRPVGKLKKAFKSSAFIPANWDVARHGPTVVGMLCEVVMTLDRQRMNAHMQNVDLTHHLQRHGLQSPPPTSRPERTRPHSSGRHKSSSSRPHKSSSAAAKPHKSSSSRPHDSAARPHKSSSAKPRPSSSRPHGSSSTPHVPASKPHVSSSKPHASASRPQASSSRPPASSSRPHASSSRPHVSSSSRPHASTKQHTRTRSLGGDWDHDRARDAHLDGPPHASAYDGFYAPGPTPAGPYSQQYAQTGHTYHYNQGGYAQEYDQSFATLHDHERDLSRSMSRAQISDCSASRASRYSATDHDERVTIIDDQHSIFTRATLDRPLPRGTRVATGSTPIATTCPQCQQDIMTVIKRHTGAKNVAATVAVAAAGVAINAPATLLPLALTVLELGTLKRKVHHCPYCDYKMGKHVTVTIPRE
ncbi:hypothetical protein H4R18_003117 [Coemansia javaensis]|uniref:LITAF domain-containing protein n=1 Tax=Coemansia javaensis TaxID=2761396 RepID=A0A9W8LIW9_9FUNG|nr:hypothetical protein H4R18_003117 [Coemansia javaensis]